MHYSGAEIRRQLDAVHRLPPEKTKTGKAVTLSQTALEHDRTYLPSLTLAMNSLPPGESQRAHRHHAVAVTLIVRGDRCDSGLAWQRHATMVTPPGAPHSHHNEGEDLALFLIVQDGRLRALFTTKHVARRLPRTRRDDDTPVHASPVRIR